jgi:hypothetical protein
VITGCAVREQVADLRQRPVDAERFDDVGLVTGGFKAREE